MEYQVYHIKLVTGESILAKTTYSEAQILEEGRIIVADPFIIKLSRILDQKRNVVSEVISLAPWLEFSDLDAEAAIPIEAIIVIAEPKDVVTDAYTQHVLQLKIRQTIANRDDAPLSTPEDGVEPQSDTGKNNDEALLNALEAMFGKQIPSDKLPNNEDDPYNHAKPREPELLDREKLLMAEIEGNIDTSSMPSEGPSENDPKPYQVNGKTIH